MNITYHEKMLTLPNGKTIPAPPELIKELEGERRWCIDTIVHHYLTAALWAGTTDTGTEPLDRCYSVESFTPAAREKAREAVESFMRLADQDLTNSSLAEAQIGHDLFLTAAGHGGGFWDRGLGDLGERLSAHAQDSHWVEGAAECGYDKVCLY